MIWMYVIIVIVVLGLYGASMTYRYLDIHSKYHRQKLHMSLHDVINEIIGMIHKEDIEVDKGAYKNINASTYAEDSIIQSLTDKDFAQQIPTLTSLISYKPTEDDYNKVLDLLVLLCQKTYNAFSFFLAKSSDETKAAHFMQVTSPFSEHTELHKEIFRLAVSLNVDMPKLQEMFADRAAKGNVLALGDSVTIITNDGSPGLATAVQPIQSGIEGSEITFIFSFVSTDKYEEWRKNTFPEVEKDGE